MSIERKEIEDTALHLSAVINEFVHVCQSHGTTLEASLDGQKPAPLESATLRVVWPEAPDVEDMLG